MSFQGNGKVPPNGQPQPNSIPQNGGNNPPHGQQSPAQQYPAQQLNGQQHYAQQHNGPQYNGGMPQFNQMPPQNQQFQQTPAPQKNWFARHKVLTAVIALVVFIIAVSAIGGGGNDTPAKPQPAASGNANPADSSKSPEVTEDKPTETKKPGKEEPAEEEPEEEETPAGFRIGDKAVAGDVTYVVKSVKVKDTLGSKYFPSKAKGKYVVVNVSVTNNSNDSILVTTGFFELKSGEKTFEADSSASFTANSEADVDSFLGTDLNPDLTMSGYIVFDVSEKVASAKDNVLKAQTGFWGTQTVEILLAK